LLKNIPPEEQDVDGIVVQRSRDASVADDHRDLRDKIQVLGVPVSSETNEVKGNEEELNDLRQKVKELRKELERVWKMYEESESDMKPKFIVASVTETDRNKIKELEVEVQHLKDKNKELADELATKDVKISEISGRIDAPNKRQNKMADTNQHATQGKMKINF
jgi:chromosome segregation ATPase